MHRSDSIPARCWAEVNLSALRHNADVARHRWGGEIMAVVKANAYGLGAVQVAEALQDKAAMLGVANLEEALELRAAGISTAILILGTCLPKEAEAALQNGFHIGVNSLAEAAALDALAATQRAKANVHIVLDTGMGRMGFAEHQWNAQTVRALLALAHIEWQGLASHLPSPDEDEGFTQAQVRRFRQSVEFAGEAGLQPQWIHLANSAGLLGYEEAHDFCNLARPGLMLYGVSPLPEWQGQLQPVLTWKTCIILLRTVPEGQGISYGRTFITKRPTRVATLACGYADGYPRQVSGRSASVLIHGQRCPLLGRVTMDQIMVDVTDLKKEPQIADEAVLMGRHGDEEISAHELAGKAGTIPWHILTGIGGRVARVHR